MTRTQNIENEIVKEFFRIGENIKAMEYGDRAGITDEQMSELFLEILSEIEETETEEKDVTRKMESFTEDLESKLDKDVEFTVLDQDEDGALVKFEQDDSKYVVLLSISYTDNGEVFEGTTKMADSEEDEEYNQRTIKTWNGALNYVIRFLGKRL